MLRGIFAGARHAWTGAGRAWALLGARRLVRVGRFPEAEARLAPAMARSPGDAALMIQHAFCAHNSGRYEEAVARWSAVLAVAPESAMAAAGLAANQREARRLDAARDTIAAALARHPDDSTILSEAARIADRQYRYEDALAHWTRLLEGPGEALVEWRQGRDLDLVLTGRIDEAEAAIAEARRRAPDHLGYLANETRLRMRQFRWDDALRLAHEFVALRPDDVVGRHLLGEARYGVGIEAADAQVDHPMPPAGERVEIERVDDDATRALLLRFESLGEDCEFGLVQRRFAAEPIGLLRWNFVAFPDLVAALDARFEGLGDPAQTEVGFFDAGEYAIRDTRWRLGMHTFVYRHQSEPGALLGKMCVRLRYLRDKLLGDLAAAEKTFVFKAPAVSLAAMRELHGALRSHGPVRLLCVVPLDQVHSDFVGLEPLSLSEIEPGLLVGALSHAGRRQDGTWDVLFDEWVALCAATEDFASKGAIVA